MTLLFQKMHKVQLQGAKHVRLLRRGVWTHEHVRLLRCGVWKHTAGLEIAVCKYQHLLISEPPRLPKHIPVSQQAITQRHPLIKFKGSWLTKIERAYFHFFAANQTAVKSSLCDAPSKMNWCKGAAKAKRAHDLSCHIQGRRLELSNTCNYNIIN
jgi:hypothetical protein